MPPGHRSVAVGSAGPGQPAGHGARPSSAEAAPQGRAGAAVAVIAKAILASGAWERAVGCEGAAAPPRFDSRWLNTGPAPLTAARGNAASLSPSRGDHKAQHPGHCWDPSAPAKGAVMGSAARAPLPSAANSESSPCAARGRDGTAFPAPILQQGSSTGSQQQAGSPGQSSAPQPRGQHTGSASTAGTTRNTPGNVPEPEPCAQRESGRARCHPEQPQLPPPSLPPSHPTQTPGPHRVQQRRAGGEAPNPNPNSPTGTPVPGCIAPQPQAPRGCTAAGAGRGVGNGRNPALSHRFLCAVSHASSSEATRGRSGAHGCVRGQPLHARVAQRKRVRTSGLQAGHPGATSSIACVHGHGCTKPCCRRCPTCRAHRNAAVHRAESTRGLTRTAPVPTAAAPGVHRRWVGSSARPHLTPQPRALCRCKMRALPKPRHSRELSLHGDPAAPRAARTKPGAHLRVHTHASVPPPKRKAPAGGRPRSVAVGGAPLAYVAARALRGWARIGGGVFTLQPYKQRDPPERLPRAAPRGEAPETPSRDPAGFAPEPQERCACARRAGEARGALPTPREPGRLLWQRASLAPP